MTAPLLRILAALALLPAAAAQREVTARVEGPSPSIVKLGSSARLEIQVSGFDADPSAPRLPQVDGLRFEVGAPFTQNYQSYINGRVSRQRTVAWDVTVTPERVGEFEIPEFPIDTGEATERLGPLRLTCVADARGEDLAFLRIRAESERVYVHEPVRLRIEYGVRSDVDLLSQRARTRQGIETVYLVHLRAPWLRELEGAVAAIEPQQSDDPDTRELALVVNEQVEHVRYDAAYQQDGVPYNRFVLERAWLPTRSGTLRIPRSVLGFRTPTGPQRRDIFGSPMRRDSEELFCYGEPLSIEVLPLPEEGRPDDYTGAVGRFELRADATPRRVQVGESVKWTLTVEGQGNVEFLGLPEIDEIEGFHILGRNENRSSSSASLTLDVTPLSDQVTGLPAVDWSSFDTTPGVEDYVELRAPAIPLEVRPLPEGAGLEALPGESEPELVAGVDDVHDIFGLEVLRAEPVEPARTPGMASRALAVFGPWILALLTLALLRFQRARRGDPAQQRARGARRAYRAAREQGRPVDETLVVYLAARLGVEDAAVIGPDLAQRLAGAGCEESLATDAAEVIERGTAARYGGGAAPEAAEVDALVERLEGGGWPLDAAVGGGGRAAAGPGLLLVGVLAFTTSAAGPVAAQQDPAAVQEDPEMQGGTAADQDPAPAAAAAQRAYRAGDYEAAAALWREALQRSDADPRLAYNLGNALFRQGRHAAALVAYERARPAMPRDPRLLANIELCERRLEVGADGSGEAFAATVAGMRDAFTIGELVLLALLCHAVAAFGLLFGRGVLRGVALAFAVPGVLLALELLVFGPSRPDQAVILAEPRARVVAEPRAGLEPVATLRTGARVAVLGRGPAWTRVALPDREGYVRTEALGFPADR